MDPRIGILNRDGRLIYYAFVHGYDAPAVEGSLHDVEAALGLRPFPKQQQTTPTTFTAILTAPDGQEGGVYEVTARNKTEARQRVRKAHREDTPPPRYGFYRFEDLRLRWRDEET